MVSIMQIYWLRFARLLSRETCEVNAWSALFVGRPCLYDAHFLGKLNRHRVQETDHPLTSSEFLLFLQFKKKTPIFSYDNEMIAAVDRYLEDKDTFFFLWLTGIIYQMRVSPKGDYIGKYETNILTF